MQYSRLGLCYLEVNGFSGRITAYSTYQSPQQNRLGHFRAATSPLRWGSEKKTLPPDGPEHKPSDDRLKTLVRDNLESGLKLKKALGARGFYARAIELAEMIGLKEPLLMKAYARLGYHLLYYPTIPEDAVEKKKAARQPWENPENEAVETRVYEPADVKQARLERAHTYLNRAIHLGEPLHDKELDVAHAKFEKAHAVLWLGDSFREQGNADAAITQYRRFLAQLVSQKQDETDSGGYVFWRISQAQNTLGNYDDALDASTRAITIFRKIQSEDYLVSGLNHHADLLNRYGNHKEIDDIRAEIAAFEAAQNEKKKKDET